MKKIIKGAVYNTETAKMLAEWDNNYPVNDFNYMEETLYRTKSGNWFLHCQGGGLSPYAQTHGDSKGWGEYINPISFENAQQWAEEKLDGDKYEEIFGIVDEEETYRINAYVTTESKHKLMLEQNKTGESISSILEKLILKCL